jgi:hypothetical protein
MQSTPPKLQVVDQLDPTKPEWYKGFRRSITEILADLSKPIPNKYLATRKQGGTTLMYLPWHTCCKLLDRCAPGWDYSITNIHTTNDRIFITAKITIRAAEGDISREATGTEVLKEEYFDKQSQTVKIRELAYGDSSSNAESMALRRCAAKFGLARYLYEKE